MKNAMTIDLEDYYQVTAFSKEVGVDRWDSFTSRIENNTARLLSILTEVGAKATFFTLGWVAKNHPKLVREIVGRGHEIACHSNIHRSVHTMSPDLAFRLCEIRRGLLRSLPSSVSFMIRVFSLLDIPAMVAHVHHVFHSR
jgi:hypothetical protein